jgi:predicted nucleic acid-binding protein
MGPLTILDTNIVIYLLEGRLAQRIEADDVCVSIITEIELLSHARLNDESERAIRAFLAAVRIVGLVPAIKDSAILLRRRHGLKIPDAIVAATALSMNATLFTNDTTLAGTPGIRCRSLELSNP